jgi:outer membrane protein
MVWLYGALLSAVASLAHAELKVGVVDVQRLAAESPQAKLAKSAIETEFGPRIKSLQDLETSLQARQDKFQKDAPTMTELQKSAADKELRDGIRDYQAKRSALEDDLNARQQDENNKMSRLLQEEIAAFARAQNFDLILADGVIFATGALDVTSAVLQSLQSRTSGAAPAGAAGAKPAAAPASTAKP